MNRAAAFVAGVVAGLVAGLAGFSGWVIFAHRRHVLKRRGWRR